MDTFVKGRNTNGGSVGITAGTGTTDKVFDLENFDAKTVGGVTASQGMATAWVDFDGTTGVIRDSYNISNVVRTDVGTYTVTIGTPMDTTNYVTVGMGVADSSNKLTTETLRCFAKTLTSFTVEVSYGDPVNSGVIDRQLCSIVIFGGMN